MKSLFFAFLLLHVAIPAQAFLTVAYLERPPYYATVNGQPSGFLVELTKKILDTAGVQATFIPLPPNRILDEVRENRRPFCSIGWFKTPERTSFATFSLPIYQDKPLVVLTTVELSALVSRHRSLNDLFRDHDLIMAQVASFSYGEAVDTMRTASGVRTLTVPTTQSVLPRLIAENRAAYMLVAPEEVSNLLRSSEIDEGRFVTLTMDDIPSGNFRHLIFTKHVPEETVAAINAAIRVHVSQQLPPLTHE